jgi:ribosomal-protein-alanine N-acetyltransferase
MIIFETARLVVRRYERSDQDRFFLVNGDDEVMKYIRPAKSRKESDKFFDETLFGYYQRPALGRWAVDEKSTGAFIGSFAILPIPSHEELTQLGYALLKDHWGKGFATELTVAGVDHAFTTMGLSQIYGLTEKENLISQKVLLKAGFKRATERPDKGRVVCWFLCRKEDWVNGG